MALTIKEIEYAKPMAKKYKMADGGGLCLLVAPSGAKLWVWRYRFDGAEKDMHFGEYRSSRSKMLATFTSQRRSYSRLALIQ